MPKRLVDGDAIWRSDSLLAIPVEYRREYTWLLPLAMANGSFECHPNKIWSDCYAYNREDISRADVPKILDAFEQAKLLFRWTVDGKTWGYWVGIEKEGRLPKPSDIKSGKFKLGEPVPLKELEAFTGRALKGRCEGAAEAPRVGLGKELERVEDTGLDTELGTAPTSTSSNPNSQTKELRSNSSTLNSTPTPTQPEPQWLMEMAEAMVARYPRTCRPEAKSDWEMCFRKEITKLANDLFDGKVTQAATFVGKKLDVFIEKSKASDNVYAPVKFFSEWIATDFDVKALRKKRKMDEDW